MDIMQDLDAVASAILAVWGIVALVLGPVVFFRARKYFPERREAISPEQLRSELATFDKNVRDSFTGEFGRLRLSIDDNHRELLAGITETRLRAEAARDLATAASHKADLVEERVNGLDRHLIDKLKHIEEALSHLRQVRRGDRGE